MREDWKLFSARIENGEASMITGKLGKALQLRPKGKDHTEYANALDEIGATIRTMRRGFYLRSRFTTTIVERELLRGER
ncbi:MAG: hypothetical protein R3A47_10340 [Polyangiales bacterium]